MEFTVGAITKADCRQLFTKKQVYQYDKQGNLIQTFNSKVDENEFCKMYKQGMTYYAIAKHFEIEPNAVKY